MGDREHTHQPVEDERPAPDEVDWEPDEHLNRPEQEDFDVEEREQYQHPVAEAELREDR